MPSTTAAICRCPGRPCLSGSVDPLNKAIDCRKTPPAGPGRGPDQDLNQGGEVCVRAAISSGLPFRPGSVGCGSLDVSSRIVLGGGECPSRLRPTLGMGARRPERAGPRVHQPADRRLVGDGGDGPAGVPRIHLGLTPLHFAVVDGLYNGATALLRMIGGVVADRARRDKEVAAVGYAISTACRSASSLRVVRGR